MCVTLCDEAVAATPGLDPCVLTRGCRLPLNPRAHVCHTCCLWLRYEPMKSVCEKYPEWLATQVEALSKEDYER